jgi:hypothetical protein
MREWGHRRFGGTAGAPHARPGAGD